MKIGIMTWFSHHNYGTVYQVAALYNSLKKMGYYPDVINYIPRDIIHYNDNVRKYLYKKIVSKYKRKEFNEKNFKDFLDNNITLTKKCNSFSELNALDNQFDAFICGSDQIWSPLCFDDKYFLNFASDNKIIAYAPSIGVSKIENNIIKEKMQKLIKRFKYLSIREETGKKIIKEIANMDAKIVLDPTLLLNENEWFSSLVNLNNENIYLPKEKYIFCYFLGESNKYYKKVLKISKKLNLKIINIPTHKHEKMNKYNLQYDVDPNMFLHLLKNAELVLTDSFHGIAFSINFNKEFYCFKRFEDDDSYNQNSRVLNILNIFNLNDRLIDYNSRNFSFFNMNFNDVNKKLTKLRNESLGYLKESIESVSKKSNILIRKGLICEYCSGCGSCANICPKKAIEIIENKEGFFQYKVDEDKCIECGLCKKVCPMLKNQSLDINENLKLYSYKSNSTDSLINSSSGGFAFDICQYFNKNGYYISGVEYNVKESKSNHVIIQPNDEEQLLRIQGSKYVQSETSNTFTEICELSKTNKIVFTGTPCQVAGLNKLLQVKGKKENVILVEIICHGVPSYKLWRKYLNELRTKKGENERKITFRSKIKSWHTRKIIIDFENKKYMNDDKHDLFYAFFRRGVVDNKSCYECPYRSKSYADLRIGDYWGNKYATDKTGVSMVIVLTEKGKEVIEILDKLKIGLIEEHSINDFFTNQHSKNLNPPYFREELLEKFDKDIPLKKLRKEYLSFVDFREKFGKVIRIVRRGKK